MAKLNSVAGLEDPLQKVFPQPILAERAPNNNDRRFPIGQDWINTSDQNVYKLAGFSNTGQPHWVVTSTGPGDVFPVTPFVVGPVGEAGYQTVQAAINAANDDGGGMVFVQPGTFTENLTLFDGVHILGASETATIISGVHTPPASGVLSFARLTLTGTASVISSAAAGSATIALYSCRFNVTNGHALDLAAWTGEIQLYDVRTDSTDDGGINNTGGATLTIDSSEFGVNSSNVMLISGALVATNSRFGSTVQCVTGASGTFDNCTFALDVLFNNDSAMAIYNSRLTTPGFAALTMNSSNACVISHSVIDTNASPAIAGSSVGALTIEDVAFLDNAAISGTVTLANGASTFGLVRANQLQVEGGSATDFIGQATLVAGTVTVANTNIAASDKVYVTREGVGASTALGVLDVSISAATSFTITARQPGTPGSTETNDVSIVNYFIARQI